MDFKWHDSGLPRGSETEVGMAIVIQVVVDNEPAGIEGADWDPHESVSSQRTQTFSIEDTSTQTRETSVLFTVDDVARQLNVSRSHIYGLIARGDLTVHRLPAIRVSQEDLGEFLASGRIQRSRLNEPRPRTIRLKHLR